MFHEFFYSFNNHIPMRLIQIVIIICDYLDRIGWGPVSTSLGLREKLIEFIRMCECAYLYICICIKLQGPYTKLSHLGRMRYFQPAFNKSIKLIINYIV